MKKINLLMLSGIFSIALTSSTNAQGLLDGFTPKKGDASVTLSYTSSGFDNTYIGKKEVSDFDISQDIISLYAKYGISNRVSVILNAPFISSKGTMVGDELDSESSLQDISVALKINAGKLDFKGGNLNLITGVTAVIPTGYETSNILSIGNNVFGVDVTSGLHLNTDVGFFSTLLASYNLRGDSNNNAGIDGKYGVPNAFALNGKIGYASSFIYVEAWASYFNSEEGVDILGPGFTGNFPEINADYSRVGLTLYKNVLPELGISLGYGKVIDGRNIGASTNYSVGLTYNFN